MSENQNNHQDKLKKHAHFPTVSFPDSSAVIGGEIGPYRLLSILGEGGFGIVYLAEQKAPVKRQVALKIIKPGMDSKQVIARFEAERQALALLEHPNIAKVFRAGSTETGRPYFAMEYIKGMPITEYCDHNKLSIKERLTLFIQVCEAIQHAHQKGIIHRDIKPSNIIVSVQDDKAVPKVIDFGVAKAISMPLTEKTMFTQQGQLIGTPEYMSPEQADLKERDIDTRTDIYSLGVVLYELLAGTLPFEAEALREGGYAEIQRIIREQEPPRPSTKLSSMGEDASKVALSRRTELSTLVKSLHKELEWIPLMAIRKERDQRYKTASDLAEDVQNYLDGNPLVAGPESAAYRFKKYVRKHRGQVAAVASIVAILVVSLIIITNMYFQSERLRIEAEDLKEDALIAKDNAEKARDEEAKQRQIALIAKEEESVQRQIAEQERNKATKAEQEAKEQAAIAMEEQNKAEEQLYAYQIAVAQRAFEDAERYKATEILNACSEELRGWEWYYLWNVCTNARFGVYGSEGVIRKGFYTASYMLPLGIYEDQMFLGGALKKFEGHELPLITLEFSSDSKYLFSMNVQGVVSGGKAIESRIKRWDIESQKEIAEITVPDSTIYGFCIDPNGDRIAISTDKEIVITDFDGNVMKKQKAHADKVRMESVGITWSPNGKYIAFESKMAYNKSVIKIWNTHNDDVSRTFTNIEMDKIMRGSPCNIMLVFSSDSNSLMAKVASRSFSDNYRKAWDIETGIELETFIEPSLITKIVSPDVKRTVTIKDGAIRISNSATGTELLRIGKLLDRYQNEGTNVKFSPDNKMLAIWTTRLGLNLGGIKILSASSKEEIEKRKEKNREIQMESKQTTISDQERLSSATDVNTNEQIHISTDESAYRRLDQKNGTTVKAKDSGQVANIEGMTIGSIEIESNRTHPTVSRSQVLNAARVRPGQSFCKVAVVEGVHRISDLDGVVLADYRAVVVGNQVKLTFIVDVYVPERHPLEPMLNEAIEKRDLELVKLMIEKGADISGGKGFAYLEKAVALQSYESVLLLLEKGVNVKGDKGREIFQKAFENPYLRDGKIFKCLIKNGADFKGARGLFGRSILHYSLSSRGLSSSTTGDPIFSIHVVEEGPPVDEEFVQYLIRNGADINLKDEQGYAPLCYAISRPNNIELISFLINNGADVNTQDKNGNTLFHITTPWKNEELLELLLRRGGEISKPNNNGLTPIQYLALYSNTDILKIIITKGGTSGSALIDAIIKEDIEKVRTIIVDDPDKIEQLDREGNSLLHYAIALQNYRVARYLVDKGIDVNIRRNKNWVAALYLAVQKSDYNIIELLLSNGSNVNTQLSNGYTPLFGAVLIKDKDERKGIVQLLMKYNANINLQDIRGNTVLHRAFRMEDKELIGSILGYNPNLALKNQRGLNPLESLLNTNDLKTLDIAKLIIEHGGSVSEPQLNAIVHNDLQSIEVYLKKNSQLDYSSYFYGPLDRISLIRLMAFFGNTETIDLLCEYGVPVLCQDDRETISNSRVQLIHNLAEMGRNEMISSLLKRGVDVNCLSRDGYTPIIYAALSGQKETVLFLIRNGADIHIKNKKNGTCLHAACRNGHDEIVRILVESGAAIDAKGLNDLTPLHLAANEGHGKVVTTLLEKGADPNMKTIKKKTPLDLAIAKGRGHEEVVQLLSGHMKE